MFLKNEIIGHRLITNKTLIYLKERDGILKIVTISFMGDIGGIMAMLFIAAMSTFLILDETTSLRFFGITALLFILSVLNVNSDYRAQLNLIKDCIEKIKN